MADNETRNDDPPAIFEPGPDPAPGSFLGPEQVFVVRQQRRIGPFPLNNLVHMLETGMIQGEDLAVFEGLNSYVTVKQIVKQFTGSDIGSPGIDPSMSIRDLFITHQGKTSGPFTLARAEGLLSSGLVSESDLVTYRDCLHPLPLGQLLSSIKRATTTLKVITSSGAQPEHNPDERLPVDNADARSESVRISVSPSAPQKKLFRRMVTVCIALGIGAAVFFFSTAASIRSEIITAPSPIYRELLVQMLREYSRWRRRSGPEHRGADSAIVISSSFRIKIQLDSVHDTSTDADSPYLGRLITYRGCIDRNSSVQEFPLGYEALLVIANPGRRESIIPHEALCADPAYAHTLRIPARSAESFDQMQHFFPRCASLNQNTAPDDRSILQSVMNDVDALGLVRADAGSLRHAAMLIYAGLGVIPAIPSSILNEEYPMTRRVSLLIQKKRLPREMKSFGNFLRTASARRLLNDSGVFPPVAQVYYPSLVSKADTEYRRAIGQCSRFSTTVRFGPDSLIDAVSEWSLESIRDYLAGNASIKSILAVGFSDSTGDHVREQEASERYARQAASWLEERAIPNVKVRGFGACMPVAVRSEGCLNNRVEIWIE